jgi:tRNA A-37 threonylcarbamoyl transferase component Bud32
MITPLCDLDEGVFGYPDSIVISRLDECAPLYEYAWECGDNGAMTQQLWMELCVEIGKTIRRFHDAGFIHHDLHAGNMVVEIKKGRWKPFLIDFGTASHDECECEYLAPHLKEEGSEADVDMLCYSLRSNCEHAADWFEEGLEALERAALVE